MANGYNGSVYSTRKLKSDGTATPWREIKPKGSTHTGAGPRRDSKLLAAEKKGLNKK